MTFKRSLTQNSERGLRALPKLGAVGSEGRSQAAAAANAGHLPVLQYRPPLLPEGKLAPLCAFVTLLFKSLRRNSRHSRKKLLFLKTGQARYQPPKRPKLQPVKPNKALLRNFFSVARRRQGCSSISLVPWSLGGLNPSCRPDFPPTAHSACEELPVLHAHFFCYVNRPELMIHGTGFALNLRAG